MAEDASSSKLGGPVLVASRLIGTLTVAMTISTSMCILIYIYIHAYISLYLQIGWLVRDQNVVFIEKDIVNIALLSSMSVVAHMHGGCADPPLLPKLPGASVQG